MFFFFSEQCIEAYELLLALAESEQSLILEQFRAAGVGSVGKISMSHFIIFFSTFISIEVSCHSGSSHDPPLRNAIWPFLVFD